MVKRPKSPDVVEEARYFTVCQPFPLNANWLFDKDQQECATWVAECIGLEHLYAIHYKPSARGMILLEVSKMFTDHERLLGEHRWSEILREPDAEEKKRVSQVFHSFYAKGRDAQKDGWKNLVVKSTWFKNWSSGTGRFKQPYPQTHWCPIPFEDKTNKPLCRPLPADRMAPPVSRVEQPVVGSATWAQTKKAGKPTAEALTKAWDEDVGSIDLVSKFIEPVQHKPSAGSSVPVSIGKSSAGTSPSTASPYPPLAGMTTPALNKSQPSSNIATPRNNKKKKPVPLNQFIGGEGNNKKSNPTWNKSAAMPSASLSPTVRSALNEPSPKPTPRSANAWDEPIQLPVPPTPVSAVKKETPPEDFSSWGRESATPTVNQESIWTSPLPTKKKSKKRKGQTAAIPESPTSGISPRSTQPSSPQVRNTIPSPPVSSTARVYPNFRASAESEEEDNSDGEGIYAALSNLKFTDVDDLPPEELEYAHVSTWERGDADAVEPETSEGAKEGRTYGNLWQSEDDPRAVQLPTLICPTHHIACSKGICSDMGKLIRAEKRKELEAQWEKEGKNKKNKGKRKGGSGDDNNESTTAEVDGDNIIVVQPPGKRRGFGKHQKAQDTPEVKEPSHIGRLRAFPADLPSGNADGESAGTSDDALESEGQIVGQW